VDETDAARAGGLLTLTAFAAGSASAYRFVDLGEPALWLGVAIMIGGVVAQLYSVKIQFAFRRLAIVRPT